MKVPNKKYMLLLILTLSFGSHAFARNHILVNNPLDSINELQNLEYSYRFSDHWTIGLTGTATSKAKFSDIELKGNSFGGVARYYFNPALQDDSWYLVGVANKTNFEASIISGGVRYSGRSDDSIAVGAGYHWFWESFNVSAGMLLPSNAKIQLKNAAGNKYKDELNPALGLEIKMGGSF